MCCRRAACMLATALTACTLQTLTRAALPLQLMVCTGKDARGAGMARVRDLIEADRPPVAASGVWVAPHVRERKLAAGVRIFELLPGHVVAMIPLPAGRHAPALQQLQHCDTGWGTLAATELNEVDSFRCVPTPKQAHAALAEFNGDDLTRRVLRDVFNVTRPCTDIRHTRSWLWEWAGGKSSARQWLTASHAGMPADSWHPDGCEFDVRPPGADFITVLTYPHSEWRAEWGGQVEFAAALCADARVNAWQEAVALRVTPAPDVRVIFSGSLLHRATNPSTLAPRTHGPPQLADHDDNPAAGGSAAWRSCPVECVYACVYVCVCVCVCVYLHILSVSSIHPSIHPTIHRYRYSAVMQLTCYNGRFFGPFHTMLGPLVLTFPGNRFLVPVACLAGLLVLVWFTVRPFHLDSRPKKCN